MTKENLKELRAAIQAVLLWAKVHGPVDEAWAIFERLQKAAKVLE